MPIFKILTREIKCFKLKKIKPKGDDENEQLQNKNGTAKETTGISARIYMLLTSALSQGDWYAFFSLVPLMFVAMFVLIEAYNHLRKPSRNKVNFSRDFKRENLWLLFAKGLRDIHTWRSLNRSSVKKQIWIW